MTEGLKSEALFLKSIFLRKSLRVAITATHLPLQGRLFLQKDGRRVRVSPNKFIYTKRKSTKEKSLCFFWRRRRDSTGFHPSCSLCEQFILCPFLLRKKTDEEFESLQTNSYIQKEKAQRKNPCAFSGAEGETRTLAPVTRPTPLAGAPRHQLEYFCIGSVYDTIRLLKERAENRFLF